MVLRMIRTYSELITIPTFNGRYQYLKLGGMIGESTFGFDRYLNQIFYNSQEWKSLRRDIIVRDNGCDLGSLDQEIMGSILIHHINPIDIKDIINRSDMLMNPEYLITTQLSTHNAIHYGNDNLLIKEFVERRPNDTCPWRQ